MTPFWQTTPLQDLRPDQWEALCDGCAKCCLQKLEDSDTQEVFYTNVACLLLDLDSCRCRDYAQRSQRVPACVTLSMADLQNPYWLPSTCAYRLLAEDQPLPSWHPLISGSQASVAAAGHSVRGKVIAENDAGNLTHHLIHWVT